jgi:hypothetical protein
VTSQSTTGHGITAKLNSGTFSGAANWVAVAV